MNCHPAWLFAGDSGCSVGGPLRHDYLDECLYLYLEHLPGGSITQARSFL